MRNKIFILCWLFLVSGALTAQQPGGGVLRVTDTLSVEEKRAANRVILKSELDSIIRQHDLNQALFAQKQTVEKPVAINSPLTTQLLVLIILMIAALGYLLHRQQRSLDQKLDVKNKNDHQNETPARTNVIRKGKLSAQELENRIDDLKTELYKLTKENESLNGVIKEYNGIQHEYEALKHGMMKAYKVKNYPGYDKSKQESAAMQAVLDTEQSVSVYAYEKFLKPILAIADANKNSPARTPATEREKILNLLVSLALLYIEHLYLRVNELAIGGKMVDRIQGLEKGNGIDRSLLKKLDTEFGSRALVIKMALKNAGLDNLAYPVFDETNLNNQ